MTSFELNGFRPLTWEELLEHLCNLELHLSRVDIWDVRRARMALRVLDYFLGEEWMKRNALGGPKGDPFMHPPTDPRPRHMAAEIDPFRYHDRLVRLANFTMNLQYVGGFRGRLRRLSEDDIESVVTELWAAQYLCLRKVPLRFVDEAKQAGRSDYELDALIGRYYVACEVKCKIEGTALSKNTVRDTLEKARKQLPANRPGIIFLQIPELWTHTPEVEAIVMAAVRDVFRNTGRISAIVFLWERWQQLEGGSAAKAEVFRFEFNEKARYPLAEFKCLFETVSEPNWHTIDKVLFDREEVYSVASWPFDGYLIESVYGFLSPEVTSDGMTSGG